MEWTERGRLTAGGRSIEYACFGPPPSHARTFVLLHEGLGSVDLWRTFPQQLSDATGWGVFAYSRAGYGRSDPEPLPWSLDYMERHALEILPEILTELNDYVLLGHSDGASISAIYAGRVCDPRLIGTILIAPHFYVEDVGVAEIRKVRDAFQEGDLRARLSKYHDNVDCAFRGWCDAWLHPDFGSWNIVDVLSGIACPVFALQGSTDAYGTLTQLETVEEHCKSSVTKCVLPGVGHSPHIEETNGVMAEVVRFADSF